MLYIFKYLDINECENYCKNATCINGNGTFQCQCPTGSIYNAIVDICQDYNECETNMHKCDPVRGICQNEDILLSNRTYNCSCPLGWDLSENNICIG